MGDSPLFSGEGGMAEVLARRTMISGALLLVACRGRAAAADDGSYRWTELTGAAPYPGAYNFPVHVAADGRFVALHAQGTWSSRDGRNWVKEPLPASGTNSAYLPLVAHEGASWAIGTIDGDYQHFTIDPVVRRTADYRGWTTVGRAESLPRLIFAAAVSFKGAIWLLGGHDGTAGVNGVWRSATEWHGNASPSTRPGRHGAAPRDWCSGSGCGCWAGDGSTGR
jgi:hypothetical protein